MRLFVVASTVVGAVGTYQTVDEFQKSLRIDWDKKTAREPWDPERAKALDEALLAAVNISHVGMVIPFRLGWVFIAEDVQS